MCEFIFPTVLRYHRFIGNPFPTYLANAGAAGNNSRFLALSLRFFPLIIRYLPVAGNVQAFFPATLTFHELIGNMRAGRCATIHFLKNWEW